MSLSEQVLVTGVSGYLAIHVADQFLKVGYRVRGTVRSMKDESKNQMIFDALNTCQYKDRFELVEADLLDSECWKIHVKGCCLVAHVASPYPLQQPENEDLILKPAINGTANVLNACIDTDVKHVVLTSSSLAITGAKQDNDRIYDEKDWGSLDGAYTYCKSKILAEKTAWDFVEERKKSNQTCFNLTVIIPSFILGPLLHTNINTSITRFLSVFVGNLEKVPEVYRPTCDVRDVALAHVRAVTLPQAAGERIAIVSEQNYIPMIRWAHILNKEFSKYDFKIPLEEEVGNGNCKTTKIDNKKMTQLLDIEPTDFNKTIIDLANSLIEKGIVKKPE